MENPFAEMLKDLPSRNTRKLLFEEQCAFYAALKLGVPPLAVASAAGLSPMGVSHLTHAGKLQGSEIRYRAVAREYADQGHENFIHRYLTAPIRERIERAIDEHKRRERNPDLNAKGFSPLATGYCDRHEWRETSLGMHVVFLIELVPDRAGYMWRNLKPWQGLPEIPAEQISYDPACQLNGDPSRGPERGPDAKGFPTSKDCFFRIKREFNPTAKQQEPLMSRTGPPRDYRIGMVEPNKGSHSPPKAPLLTRISRARAENEARNREWERDYERKQEAEQQTQAAERRARVEAEVQRMLAEQAEQAEREKLKNKSHPT